MVAKRSTTDIDLENVSKIINMPSPINAGDGANKLFVENLISAIRQLPEDGTVGQILRLININEWAWSSDFNQQTNVSFEATNDGEIIFQLSDNIEKIINKTRLLINGLEQDINDFNIVGNQLVLPEDLNIISGDRINLIYYK